MSRSSFLLLTFLLAAAGSVHAQAPAKETAVNCKGPFKTLLEASAAEKRGVTLFSIPMLAPAEKNFSPCPRITITWASSAIRASRMAASSCRIIS